MRHSREIAVVRTTVGMRAANPSQQGCPSSRLHAKRLQPALAPSGGYLLASLTIKPETVCLHG
jgi:hypothetical protein